MSSDTGLAITATSSPKSDVGGSENNDLLDGLRHILAEQSHLFACGGDIPIREPKGPDLDKTSGDEACAKLSLPTVQGEAGLDRLLQHARPATFGRGGQDVYDESYRKALQMDPATFCTTFEPYSVGIIDAVAQVLLPSVSDSTTHRAVRAELYKLNIYSGPSRKFKPHVDTPRSSSQFGSLVICLPVKHTGGHLKVRHKEQEVVFDWSADQDKPDHDRIRWAAFYSDCEHEVLEVTSGHRLTLTYNLYAVRGAGRLTGVSPTLNPVHLPLFQALKEVLSQDPFGCQGGTLGFWCSHSYAYNHTEETPLPATLKGVDAVLWESFQALNLDPKIAPVITMSEDIREMFPSTMPCEWIIGHKFGVHVDSHLQVESLEEYHETYQRWGSYNRESVHWLTTPKESEPQLVFTAYGNEATTEAMYSNCAILVKIPSRQ
ncbi:oxidoreductase, 2OG-Fe(II) oxygenase family protein [Cordyceps javanica]|uniref:Oxidoreductase, 2OG-Fe(II) oxygenase family protein n=1 Tax=Cordyceps javanica TaxID=43265 RepID=A0A545VJF3_9HYPO|nr:oxidoreductase, 2OG-Fe(II) oxygenase family protein [Cordyceps javanica]TQW01849.1 oxidoreductase, 2OG-Fe(II) oxygenase family protein [Cordyceps javanica]